MSNIKARFKTTSKVSKRSRLEEYRAGQFVFQAGDLGTEMYVIHDGRAEVTSGASDRDSDSAEGVATLEKGDFFGEMAVLEEVPRSASVRALTDLKLVRIDGSTFTQLLRAEPEIAIRIMRKLSRRLREANARLESKEASEAPSTAAPPETEIAARLVHQKSGTAFELPMADPILVGRRDPITGIEPHIDLSAIDPDRSCSRQHAKLLRDGSHFFLVEDIGTTNGTFLNGERLDTGARTEIHNGDAVRFGTVSVDFEVG